MPQPPVAPRKPTTRSHHGHQVIDDYDWLRNPDDPEVLEYLRAENDFAEAELAHLAPVREALFEEIRGRTQETDLGVAVGLGPWWYYQRSFEGKQYVAQCRTPRRAGEPRPVLSPGVVVAGEQVVVDGNVEAQGSPFYQLGACEVSVCGDLVALAHDRTGDERYDVVVRRIVGGEVVDEALRGVGTDLVWSLDGRHLFYTRLDEAWRPHEIWRHELGTDPAGDVRLLEENDERFWLGISSSRDDRWLIAGAGSKTTSQMWLLDLSTADQQLRPVAPRREGVEYSVEVAGDRLLVTHNADSPDFDLAWAPLDATSHEQWQLCGVREASERILGVEAFTSFSALSLRKDGLTAIRILPHDPGQPTGFGSSYDIVPGEALFTIETGTNLETETRCIQVVTESLVSPRAVWDVDVVTGEWTLLRRQPVLGGYDPQDYEQHREWAIAADGTRVPISVVHRRGIARDGSAPGLLMGYGAYEVPLDPWFSVARLSLMDRGLVVALAHVRGGGEQGRAWYEQGRLRHKITSMTDFLACADRLVEAGWVSGDRLAAEGGSAGGLLVGSAAMLAPERFSGVLAEVPFVDALTTMLDPSLPLTVTEYEEWGNPTDDPDAYADIAAYSPYDLVRSGVRYPAILTTTSLNDARVSYAEPAKWVARLRAVAGAAPRRPPLLRTELVAGHGGRSGRYDVWRQVAWEYAFVLDSVGATDLLRGGLGED